MKKTLNLYDFVDNDGEILLKASTMSEIKDFFLERYKPMFWEDDLTDEMVEKIKRNDKAFLNLLNESWRAKVELVRTITSDDLIEEIEEK